MSNLVLSQKEFTLFQHYIYDHLGINLGAQKNLLGASAPCQTCKTAWFSQF